MLMKNSSKLINARRAVIEETLHQAPDHTISVSALADHCCVSAMTMRRDLAALQKMGVLVHKHGYATLSEHYHFKDAKPTNTSIEKIKISIGKMAANFVRNKDTVFINTSSTALYALDYLQTKRVSVVTNNLRIHEQIHKDSLNPASTVIITGGELRLPKEALTGEVAEIAVKRVIADVAIIGCSGFSLKNGITTSNAGETNVNRLMIEHTKGKVIVVADHRKIFRDSNFFVAASKTIDVLVTDEFADAQSIADIEQAGIEVIQVNIGSRIAEDNIDNHTRKKSGAS